jgi:O-6-methylguanine DNA methyltransferase
MSKRCFANRVKQVVRNIPPGATMSYQAVAQAAGNPRAYRAVANCLAKNFDPTIPCHRVIHSDGRIGNYNRGGTRVKRSLLRMEGVILD